MKISVSMITLNEDRHILRSLSSCTFADDIVIVDGGSTDGTLGILESFEKIKLVQHPWEGHFGKQRQISLENCTGDWVIRLDADEVLSEEFEKKIRTLLESTPSDIVGYKIRKCNLVGSENFYAKAHDCYEDTPRIWRNLSGVKWERAVHEIPVGLNGKISLWDVYIVHYNLIDKKRFREKGLFYSNFHGSGFNSPEDLYYREYDIRPRPYRTRVASHVPSFSIKDEGNGLPRVAIIRGPNLNQWEMQNYESLAGQLDITAYTTTQPNFDINKIKLPVVKLPNHPDHPAYMVGLEFALFDKDLIYTADTTWLFSYQAILIKEKFGKKVVCLQWENIPFAYEENEQVKAMKARVRQEADHFIAVTERAKQALILEDVSSEKITVIPMGIDVERFKPDRQSGLELRKKLGIPPKEKVILFTGRMVWEKGIYDFIYSAKLALQKLNGIPTKFIVIGKGPELQTIKDRGRDLGIEKAFIFIENYPYHKIHRMYNLADVFVLPSISTRIWKEQFGMVLIEAMACGVPVISTYSGSIPDVVGDAGILVQSNDPSSLASAIVELLKNNDLRRKLSSKGRKRVDDEFNSRKISDRMGSLFESILEDTGKYPRVKSLCDKVPNSSVEGEEKILPDHFVRTFNINPEASSDRTSNAIPASMDAKGSGYYSQERYDVEAIIPGGALRILDVGCGEGILGKRLLGKGASEVVGIEIDSGVCESAKENLRRVICGDVEEIDLSFDEKYFDCMIFADILEHLKDPLSTLKKLRKNLSDSGVIVASIPNVRHYRIIGMLAEGHWKYEDHGILDKSHLKFFTKKEIETLFREAGFEITGITANIDPAYNTLSDPLSGEISFGRVSLKGLTPEELKDLFVVQYLIKAQKAGHEEQKVNEAVSIATASGNLEEAKRALEDYLEMYPADMDFLYKHAEVYYNLGMVDKAMESLDRILLFEPAREEAIALRRKIGQ